MASLLKSRNSPLTFLNSLNSHQLTLNSTSSYHSAHTGKSRARLTTLQCRSDEQLPSESEEHRRHILIRSRWNPLMFFLGGHDQNHDFHQLRKIREGSNHLKIGVLLCFFAICVCPEKAGFHMFEHHLPKPQADDFEERFGISLPILVLICLGVGICGLICLCVL